MRVVYCGINRNIIGLSVNTPNKEESMPLHIASFSGHADIVELLIKEGIYNIIN